MQGLMSMSISGENEMDKHSLRCDDCGQFAKAEELSAREPWLGGVRHREGFGCCSPEAIAKIRADVAATAARRRAEIEEIVNDYNRSFVPQAPTVFTENPSPNRTKFVVAGVLVLAVITILFILII